MRTSATVGLLRLNCVWADLGMGWCCGGERRTTASRHQSLGDRARGGKTAHPLDKQDIPPVRRSPPGRSTGVSMNLRRTFRSVVALGVGVALVAVPAAAQNTKA